MSSWNIPPVIEKTLFLSHKTAEIEIIGDRTTATNADKQMVTGGSSEIAEI